MSCGSLCLANGASLASVERLCLAILDIENCFQNTLVEVEDRVVVTLPNFYMEVSKWEYPEYAIEESPSGKYVVQPQHGIQGDQSIGQKFYLTINGHVEKFGLLPCPQETTLCTYRKNGIILLVNTSSDDFLCEFLDVAIFYKM